MLELTDVINKVDQTDIYMTFQPNTTIYLPISIIELSPKLTTNLDTKQMSTDNKKTKILRSLSYHHRFKGGYQNNKELTNLWKMNNSLLNERCIKTELRKKNQRHSRIEQKWTHSIPNFIGHECVSKKQVHSTRFQTKKFGDLILLT